MVSRFVIAFLPRSKHLLITWLQSPSPVILEPKKIKSVTVFIVSSSICHEVMGPDDMILVELRSSPLKTIKTQPMSSAKSSDSQSVCLMVLKVSSFNQWHHHSWAPDENANTQAPLQIHWIRTCVFISPPANSCAAPNITWYIWCMWYSEQHCPIELFMMMEIQAVAWCCPCCYLTLFWARSLFATSILPKFVLLGSFLLHVTSSPADFF